jgi:hypothetical protein
MRKQLKIGIVTTWFERGAAYVSKAYKEALSHNHSVYIYARGGEESGIGNPQWNTPDVTWGKHYPMPITHTYIDRADFIRWIREKQLDIVFF